MLRRLIYPILSILLLPGIADAQLTTGTVQGTVQDPSGAIVPGVEMALLNVDTNLTLTQHTNDVGTYVFSNVPPGTYRLRAILDGFKTADTTGLVVEVNRNTVVNVKIEPGDLKESVQVVAAADIIDTQSSVVRTNIGTEMITELPSDSRNPLGFAELAPGVDLNTNSLAGGSQMLGLSGVSANVSGARQQQNTFYLDGADNSSIRLNEGLQAPNVEAIAEVQVVTNSNSAEYGRQPGGYFNIITKSGTNQYTAAAFFISAMPLSTPTSGNATEAAYRSPPPTCGRQAARAAAQSCGIRPFSSALISASLIKAPSPARPSATRARG